MHKNAAKTNTRSVSQHQEHARHSQPSHHVSVGKSMTESKLFLIFVFPQIPAKVLG